MLDTDVLEVLTRRPLELELVVCPRSAILMGLLLSGRIGRCVN